jgi:hypothetical protein
VPAGYTFLPQTDMASSVESVFYGYASWNAPSDTIGSLANACSQTCACKGFTFIDSKSYAKKSVEKALQVALDPTTFFCWGLYIRDAPCEGKRPPELTLCA